MKKHTPETAGYANLETNFVFLGNPEATAKLPIAPLGYTATDDLWR